MSDRIAVSSNEQWRDGERIALTISATNPPWDAHARYVPTRWSTNLEDRMPRITAERLAEEMYRAAAREWHWHTEYAVSGNGPAFIPIARRALELCGPTDAEERLIGEIMQRLSPVTGRLWIGNPGPIADAAAAVRAEREQAKGPRFVLSGDNVITDTHSGLIFDVVNWCATEKRQFVPVHVCAALNAAHERGELP